MTQKEARLKAKMEAIMTIKSEDLSRELSVDSFEIVGAAQKEIPGFSERFTDMFFENHFTDREYDHMIRFVMKRLEGDNLKDNQIMRNKIIKFLNNYLGIK